MLSQCAPISIGGDLQVRSGQLQGAAAMGGGAGAYYDATATALWSDIQNALNYPNSDLPVLPEVRTEYQDWVRDGLKLPRWEVAT